MRAWPALGKESKMEYMRQHGVDFRMVDGFMTPCIIMPKEQTISYSTVGYYGWRRYKYLCHNNMNLVQELAVDEKLQSTLASLNEKCEAREEELKNRLMERAGIDEEMWHKDWYKSYTTLEQSIHSAREIVCEEFGIDRP